MQRNSVEKRGQLEKATNLKRACIFIMGPKWRLELGLSRRGLLVLEVNGENKSDDFLA